MLKKLGTTFYVISVIFALLGLGALILMLVGLKEDALAAAPALLIAQPWPSIVPFLTAGDTTSALTMNVVVLGIMLAINPLIFFGLGRWFRR